MNTCTEFDKYRDGELGADERNSFESHLAVCEDCRTKISLLNNLVCVLKLETSQPPDLSYRIARRAFRQGNTWDALVLSWLRPGPALATLTIMLALCSFLWLAPGSGKETAYSQYENLMEKADTLNLGNSLSQVPTDSELVLWLEQEVNSQ